MRTKGAREGKDRIKGNEQGGNVGGGGRGLWGWMGKERDRVVAAGEVAPLLCLQWKEDRDGGGPQPVSVGHGEDGVAHVRGK